MTTGKKSTKSIFAVSIPHRYATDKKIPVDFARALTEFQSLIGTLQTNNPTALVKLVVQFQSLIGTLQTFNAILCSSTSLPGFNPS